MTSQRLMDFAGDSEGIGCDGEGWIGCGARGHEGRVGDEEIGYSMRPAVSIDHPS